MNTVLASIQLKSSFVLRGDVGDVQLQKVCMN